MNDDGRYKGDVEVREQGEVIALLHGSFEGAEAFVCEAAKKSSTRLDWARAGIGGELKGGDGGLYVLCLPSTDRGLEDCTHAQQVITEMIADKKWRGIQLGFLATTGDSRVPERFRPTNQK